MFSSRRQRGSSTSRTRSMDQSTSTSNAATLAARSAAAGLYRPASNTSLSSAAAAAALRSATTTPEPVGSIQTKRMVRRGSQSSIGSSVAPVRGGLQRQNSSGSMTDRTFRSPSPGSSNGNGYTHGATSPDPYAPPVPAIPRSLPSGHKRSSSLEPPQNQRVMSPNRARGARGVSADRAGSMLSNSLRKPPRLSDVVEQLEPSDANRNMNFSRPRTSQPSSPVESPTSGKKFTHGTGAWHSEPAVNQMASKQGPSATALEQKIERIQAAQGQPVRKSNAVSSSQGVHLTKANLDAVSAAAAEYETVMVFDAASRTFVPQQRLKTPAPEPASPTLPQAPALKPGQYDPSTRTIVPQPAQPTRPQRAVPPPLDTNLAPPPRNPARLSPTTSPTTSRHPPLNKYPSVVYENPEEEEPLSSVGSDFTDTGRIIQTSAGPAKAYTTIPATRLRSSSLDVPRGSLTGSVRGRQVSASPSPARARFSASPVVQATIHDPPSRDISPAKSALKHSPSVRAASPLAHYSNPKSPSSETSETPSLASRDGTGKKKKSVRVSFDEEPHVAEIVTPTTSRVLKDLDDDDDLMKPMPALPSFGSVRKSRNSPGYAEKVTEMAPERNVSVSSDHAIAGILSNANGHANSRAEPVVTSKETTNDASDSDYSGDEQAKSSAKVDEAGVVSRDFAPAAAPSVTSGGDVPAINLSPPTPGVEQQDWVTSAESGGEGSPRARLSKEVILPGGWNSAENEAEADGNVREEPAQVTTANQEPLHAISELADANDDDDDDDAQFSDAAEEQSDLEGGFASLDAIAVSPVVPSPNTTKIVPPESPLVAKATKKVEQAEAAPVGDWTQATAYWSTLSKQQREQIEREHFSSDDEALPVPAVKKIKKKTAQRVTNGVATNGAVNPAQKSTPAQPSAQPAKPAMKKTMRGPPEPAPTDNQVHMRSSMRAGGGSGMASTMRDGSRPTSAEPRKGSFTQKTMRGPPASNQSTANAPTYQRQTSQSSIMSQSKSSQPATTMSPRLQKELRKADDSDSDSSFRKQRRSARTHAGFSMKSSMRAEPEPAAPPARQRRAASPEPPRNKKGRDSFSIRSLSPTGSLFGRKKMNRDPVRAASVDPGTRTLRSAPPQPQKSALRNPTAAPTKPAASRFKSRFADSDDEDDEPSNGGRFASRFADSDDEDDVFTPVDLAPVRGIPRRHGQNDGDSTDLSDEDDTAVQGRASMTREKFNTPLVPEPSDIDRAMEAARKKLGITESPASKDNHTNQGGALAQGSLRDNAVDNKPEVVADSTPKKRGFMGGLLRRNRASTASVPTSAAYRPTSMPSTPTSPGPAVAPTSPIVGAETPSSPSPGAAKLVRRTSYQPQAPKFRRGDSTYSTATAPPAVGESNVSDWPLPPVPSIPDGFGKDDRPYTSEGNGVRFSEDTQVYSARTGRKKKFGMLRRAFGLHD